MNKTVRKHQELFQKQTELDSSIEQYIQKADEFHRIGLSVSQKCFGKPLHYVKNHRDYFRMSSLEWFLYWDDRQKNNFKLTPRGLEFSSPKFSKHPNARNITIPISLFSMSDRDFAKTIRKSIRSHQAHQRYVSAQHAAMNIPILEKEKTELEQRIAGLHVDSEHLEELGKEAYKQNQLLEQQRQLNHL